MRDVLVTRWSEIGDKMVKLAEEFPEDRYDARAGGRRPLVRGSAPPRGVLESLCAEDAPT